MASTIKRKTNKSRKNAANFQLKSSVVDDEPQNQVTTVTNAKQDKQIEQMIGKMILEAHRDGQNSNMPGGVESTIEIKTLDDPET